MGCSLPKGPELQSKPDAGLVPFVHVRYALDNLGCAGPVQNTRTFSSAFIQRPGSSSAAVQIGPFSIYYWDAFTILILTKGADCYIILFIYRYSGRKKQTIENS